MVIGRNIITFIVGILTSVIFLGSLLPINPASAQSRDPASYDAIERAAYEIFNSKCFKCHGEDNFDYFGDLDYLTDLDRLVTEGARNNYINCSNAAKSKLMVLIDRGDMPQQGAPLDSPQRQRIRTWIEYGCQRVAKGQIGGEDDVRLASQGSMPYADQPAKQAAWLSLNNHCSSCHNPRSVNGGGGFYRILDLDYLARGDGPKPYVDACTPDNSLLLRMIRTGSMPKGRPIVDAPEFSDDIAAIETWIHSLGPQSAQSALPERQPLRQEDLYRLALEDLRSLNPSALAHARFISLAVPYSAGTSEADLRLFRLAIGKLMNVLSSAPRIVKPTDVAGARGLMLRVDLRDYGWTAADWHHLENAYPYGRIPFRDQGFATLQQQTGTRLPILRGDWLAFVASRPSLYYDLLRLPQTVAELEHQVGGAGFSPARNIRERRVIRAGYGAGESGVSFNSRLIERHDLPSGGVYWQSYDFGGQNRLQNLEETPFGPTVPAALAGEVNAFQHDGGEFIFSLPNGLHGYFLANAEGQRLKEGPSDIVQDSSRLDRIITNGVSCISCHAAGIQIRPDAIRDDVLDNPSFSPRARAVLSELHPRPERLQEIMLSDEQDYLYQLQKLDLAVPGAGGRLVPVLTGDGIEPVRHLSDWYEEALDLRRVATEFDLSLDDLKRVAVGNRAATYTSRSSCERTPRATFEDDFAELLPRLTASQPTMAHRTTAAAAPYVPETTTSPLGVRIELPKIRFAIGDEFFFHVFAQRACKFIVFTIDSAGKVEVHNPALPEVEPFMGPSLLRAGERRRIPIASSDSATRNVAIIEPPAGLQQIGAVCSLDGLDKLGISDYEMKIPTGPDAAKEFNGTIQRLRDRFDQGKLSAVTTYYEVTE